MADHSSDAVTDARAIIGGDKSVQASAAIALVKQLKRERKFSYARRTLAVVRSTIGPADPLRIRLGQEQAICTYKDTDLPAERRLDRALEVLREVDNPDSAHPEQETLGIAGAIWKRRSELTARQQDLEQALAYYEAGALRGFDGDSGYTAINAAFALDLLAAEHLQLGASGGGTQPVSALLARARAHRDAVIVALGERRARVGRATFVAEWWWCATLAEAYLGNGDAELALKVLEDAMTRSEAVEDWKLESTARQLAMLTRLHTDHPTLVSVRGNEREVVARLIGSASEAIGGLSLGKVGLALSGGGFRASFFHIGVLARLAELDLLRHVEVISCVSGGSIVGAHYYLKLKAALEATGDGAMTREQYIRIVRDLASDFTAGAQTNIRVRILAEFTTNLRMLFERGFTRTKRAGELYEREIYSRKNGDGTKSKCDGVYMSDLLIRPSGDRSDFHPLFHNWRRGAKVPILVLNATTLNTGHNWQFTATWMGEPPGDIDSDVDGNYRLRRLYYEQAPAPYQKAGRVRLGHAVGASSAVPALFDPVEFSLLYEHLPHGDTLHPEPITVRLVDGGVHDNQGTASLTDQDCAVQVVSDASGQMGDADQPSASPWGVLLRSTSIQGARVRTAEYDDLSARRRGRVLRGLLFVHLKRGLGVEQVDWRGCDEPFAKYGDKPRDATTARAVNPGTTPYGLAKEAQVLIANVRTDLDTFSDGEASALMLSGYNITRYDAANCGLEPATYTSDRDVEWGFQKLGPVLAETPAGSAEARRLRRLLTVGSKTAFKTFYLIGPLKVAAAIVGLAASSTIVWALYQNRDALIPMPRPTYGRLAWAMLGFAIAAAGGGVARRLLAIVDYRKTAGQLASSIALAGGGFVVARLHLWIFDPLYRRWGSIDHFVRPTGGAPPVKAPPDALSGARRPTTRSVGS